MKNKRKLMLLILPLAVIAGILIWFVNDFGTNNENAIKVSGNIEATDAQASFKLAGRVEQRPAAEGQSINNGDLIAVLDANEFEQEVAIRRADLQLAKANLAELEAGSRQQEIDAARATFERAEAEMQQQKRDYQRQKELYEKNVISEQEHEKAQTAFEVATARLKESREQFKLVEEGPRKEKIQQARARVEQAKEALKLAEIKLSYTKLFSPLSGIVLSEHIEPGEYVVPGTAVITIADLQDIWLRAYINETDLGKVKVGQKVEVTTDSYPNKKYQGRISFIASQAEFTPKTVQTQEQRVKLVYRIKIEIDNPDMELKPGMPADAVVILPESSK